jgi:hypothetical protein
MRRGSAPAQLRAVGLKAIHQVEGRDVEGVVSESTVKLKYHRLGCIR